MIVYMYACIPTHIKLWEPIYAYNECKTGSNKMKNKV